MTSPVIDARKKLEQRGFVDGSKLEGILVARPDVCIIGSGAGGSVTAQVLADAGFDVLVVEEGGHYTKRDFRMREDTAFPQLYQEDGGRSTEDLGIAILQGRSVGGSTTINWTTCFRTPDDVLEHWKKKHGVAGFSQAELAPHWDEVEARLGIAEFPLAEANRNNRLLYDGCQKLGWEAKPIRRNVRGCLKSGYCGMGCPVDAKQSMLVTYLPDAVAKGATVVSRCRAERFERTGNSVTTLIGTLLGSDDRTPTGATLTIEPKRFILAGGAINGPALLLRSGITLDGRVGRRTFLHPTVAQLGIYKEPVSPFFGAPQSVASHQHAHRGDDVGFVLETAPAHPMLAALAAPGMGADLAGNLKQLSHTAAHIALLVDGFHDDVAGGVVKLRPSGAPLLSYDMSERLWRGIRDAVKAMARVQLASGAEASMTTHDPPCILRTEADIARIDGYPFATNRAVVFSAHVMGGLGLGDDPKRGCVNSSDFRLHGIDNLHVVDGSLFPTSLGVNPQLSIYGLARLAATRLASAWKRA